MKAFPGDNKNVFPGSRAWPGKFNSIGTNYLGGFNPKQLSPIFLIKDLTQVVGGYFVDSSGNNKQIQAATTTTTNDSLILPANDSQIIAAVTAAGCYSQFYTDDSNPKTVLLSNISPCYNDYGYYGYIEKKNYFLCPVAKTTKRDDILNYLNLEILAVQSVQGVTPANVTGTYQCDIGKLAYIDYGNWGNQSVQKVNATLTDHVIASTGYQANTTYQIQLFSQKGDNGFRKLLWNNTNISGNLTLKQLPTGLTYLYWYTLSGLTVTGTIADLPTGINYLQWYNLTNLIVTGTIDQYPSTINNVLINSNIVNSNIGYTGGTIPAWGSVAITFQDAWTETELRDFFINWATTAGIGVKTIDFAGNNAAIHVNLTDDPDLYNSIQTLISKGKTLLYNNY